MTVSSDVRKTGPYAGNGVSTAYTFYFKVFSANDLRVVRTDALAVETDLTLNVDYTVSLNPDQDNAPGGTVTYPVSGSPLPVGEMLTLLRDVSFVQSVDLVAGGNFHPGVIENALDRLTMLAQQNAEAIGRAAKVGVAAADIPTIDVLLAAVAANAATATAAAATATAAAANATVLEATVVADHVVVVADHAAVVALYDAFDDRYLGSKAADPALDNDGNALLTSALYWNTVVPEMRVYTGAAWEAVQSTSAAIAAAASELAAEASELAAAASAGLAANYAQLSMITDYGGLTGPADNYDYGSIV